MKKIKISTILSMIILIAATIMAIFPFYMMTIMSTRTNQQIITKLYMLPGNQLINNAKMVFESGFLMFYLNSFYIAVSAAVIGVLFSAAAGFAIAKYTFKANRLMQNMILIIMSIPFGVSIVGFLIEMKNLGLSNTHLPMIISAMISPYGVFLFTQFAKDGFPTEIMESARIDGCNEMTIFYKMFLPFTRSAAVTLFLMIFMYSWNNFLTPLVFINKQSMYTIPLGIFALGNQYRQEYGARMFALTLATIPILIIFAVNSKSLIRGLTSGAVKG
ncbi:MAG: sugar transporter ATP-binding protein [Clostridia bacterium]|jgi:multiple sugar transport system permease protein/cellobiose transport system permease protein|nr:sugar transporter ATP-binding protein [Clostridia bacterium]